MHKLLATSLCFCLLGICSSVCLRAYPQQPRAAVRTASMRALLKDERVAEAARTAERACAGAPREAALLLACGDVWFRHGSFARAEQAYAAAVQTDPADARAYWGLGRVDLVERRNRSAGRHFATAYALDPRDPDIVLDWALARPTRAQRLEAAGRYLDLAARVTDRPDALCGIKARVALLKALGERDTFVVSDATRGYRVDLREARGPDGPLNAYRLGVVLNGEKLRLTLDTGTSGIYVNRKAADRARLVRLADGVPVRGVGDEGPRSTFVALADRLQVGDLEMRQCEVKVDSGRPFADGDGVIGTDVFSRFTVRVDFPGNRLDLLPVPAGEKSIADDFWGVERELKPGFTPVHVLGHLLLADTRLDDVPGFLLVVDSGAATDMLSTSAATRIGGMRLANAVVQGISGRVRQTLTTNRITLAFGNLVATLLHVPTVNMDEQSRCQGTEIAGVIGLDALQPFVLTIDYTNGLVRLDRRR